MKTLKEIHIEYLNNGFWHEIDKEIVLNAIKRTYKSDAIEGLNPVDIIINEGKVLVKWCEEINLIH